jgi:predicted transcriptional regulator
MLFSQKLEEMIKQSVLPDIEDRMDELYEVIADKKNESIEEAKEELEELIEFRDDLKEILVDIECGEIEEDECEEILNDIISAQTEEDDEE